MSNEPPAKIPPPPPFTPSRLDLERTSLANERTLLAYVRTTIAFFIGGGTLMKFFDSVLLEILGAVSLAVGAGVMLIGLIHYRRTVRLIGEYRSDGSSKT